MDHPYTTAPAPAEAATDVGAEGPAHRSALLSMRHYSSLRAWVWRAILLISFGLVGAMLFGCGGGDPEDEDTAQEQQAAAGPGMKVPPRPNCAAHPELCR